MEFDEMKKIWDTQNNRSLYVIDEQALHNRVRSKRNRAEHIASFTEWLGIITFLGSAVAIAITQLSSTTFNVSVNVLAAWLLITSVFIIVARLRRLQSTRQYERTILGDLQNAISNATYQVRFSFLMRWNALPIAVLSLFALIGRGEALWTIVVITVVFVAAFIGSGWEHRMYENRKRELEVLWKKLSEEPEKTSA